MKKSKHGYYLGDVLLEMRDYDSGNVWSFQIEANLCRIFLLFVYICIAVGDLVFKQEDVWDPINMFNPQHYVCLSQANTWISICICRSLSLRSMI